MGGQPVRPSAPGANNPAAPGANKPGGPGTPARPTPAPGKGLVGGGAGLAGQKPYTPFENDKLDWLSADKESAAPAISRLGGTKPSLLLFIGSGDKDQCCARTFERSVFRDDGVVKYSKEHFITVRLDRESEIAKKFDIKKPSLVILDSEGDEVARFIDCTNPQQVQPILEECETRAREIKARTAEWAPRIVRAEDFAEKGRLKDASSLIAKALRADKLSRALREKIGRVAKALDERAQARLDASKATESADPIAAWREDRSVRDDFWGLPASARAMAAITAIERDPANKDRLKEAREAESKGKAAAPAAAPKADGAKPSTEPAKPGEEPAEQPAEPDDRKMPVPADPPEAPRSDDD